MTTLRFTTDGLAPADGFSHWYDLAQKAHTPSYVHSAHEADFRASLRTVGLEEAVISDMTFAPLRAARTAKLIRSHDPEHYQLMFMLRGGGGIAVADRQSVFEARQFIILNTSQPWKGWQESPTGSLRMLVVDFPRTALRLPTSAVDDLVATPLDAGAGLGAVLLSHLRQVLRQADTYTSTDRLALTRTTIDLITAALAHHLDAAISPPTRLQALLPQVYHFIDQHLPDPALSPNSIAAAHRISVRYLHKLFESEEATVATWIRQQRLQRCRRDLSDPRLAGRPVSAIAACWGFTDRAHFTRVFRTAFGMTPGEYRRAHLGNGQVRSLPHSPRTENEGPLLSGSST
ncbi:helix-turn-helix domain-containing protein [Actinomadura sediminis]|uniref:Helix-turn-helix domain-containing protein n=1 Tax=Actinomadura sediminis TaxID=1038904 RepID=A0ABW3EJ65_9ACTN